MIIIIGSSIAVDDLPSFSEYKIFEETGPAKIALRMTSNPIAIFVREDLASEFESKLIKQEIRDMFTYFIDDNDLLKKISGVATNDTESRGNNIEKQTGYQNADTIQTQSTGQTQKQTGYQNADNGDNKGIAQAQSIGQTQSMGQTQKQTGYQNADTMQTQKQTGYQNVDTMQAQKQTGYQNADTVAKQTGFTGVAPQPQVQPVTSPKQTGFTGVAPPKQDNTVKSVSNLNNLEIPKEPDDDIITEIDDDVLSDAFKIPISQNGSYDALSAKLKAKEAQLLQFQDMYKAKCEEYESMLNEQDVETANLIQTYEDKLKEAFEAFNKLKADYASVSSTTGKYHIYAEKSKGVLREGFAASEKEIIQNLGINLKVMCTSGDITDMHFMIKENIETFKEDYVIIDLTGEHFFDMIYQCLPVGALKLFQTLSDEAVDKIRGSVCHKEKCDILTAFDFHDIIFLDADWVTFFKNIKTLFPDRQILLVFNSISSFSVLYTLSKLATIFKAYVHLRCSYFSIQNTFTRLRLVPLERGIKLVATYYFDDVKDIISEVGKKYEIKMSTDVLSFSAIDGK